MKHKSALIVIGEGVEEMEAVAPVDLLRRAGLACTVASREPALTVLGRNGITLTADRMLEDVTPRLHDALVIPGGPGIAEMRKDARVIDLVRDHRRQDRLVAAICAAPLVLLDAGVLPGPRYTGHLSVQPELPAMDVQQDVVVDDNVITSRGAGTAVSFGLALVAALCGPDEARAVAHSIHASL